MNFDFGYVLNRAWKITWKHKVLWIFGIFAGCGRGGGNGGGGGGGGGEQFSNGLEFGNEVQQFLDQTGQWIEKNWWIILVIAIVFLLLIALAIFLGTIGRIGLIKGTTLAEGGAESLAFGNLFRDSLPYFWRILGLSVLVGLAFLVLLSPLIAFGIVTAGIGFLCLLPLLCILIPLLWAVMAVVEQANAAIVIENLRIMDGLRRGWEICRSNVGAIVLMALILWIGSGIIGIVIALPIFAIVLGVISAGLTTGDVFRSTTPLIVAGLCMIVYIPVLIVLSGILTAYVQSAWALTYIRLSKQPEKITEVLPANA